jgi:8-oxo-dGTP pyrophosphatase MutT (NUDIX family)
VSSSKASSKWPPPRRNSPLPVPDAPAIPRPPGARPGGAAPWAGVSDGGRRITLEDVRSVVAARSLGAEPEPSPAATLLALFEEGGEARVILIRRAVALPVHPGEIGLPGGRAQPGETMVAAALRETHEEVGVDPADVEVIGWLDRVVGRTSGSVATPIVGLLADRPHLVPDPVEVESTFDVALADLLAEGVYREERWDTPAACPNAVTVAKDRPVYFFELPEGTVWGMTARVLRRLLVLVTRRTARPPPAPAPAREGTTPPAPA